VIAGFATGLSAPGHLAVAPPLSVATRRLPRAWLQTRYDARPRADLGTTPYAWQVARGHLPPGLHLRRATISGRPRRAGTYRFVIAVRDASRPQMRASEQLAITVRSAGQPPRRSAHHAVASRPIRQPTRTVN
jgi:hypothetical protein